MKLFELGDVGVVGGQLEVVTFGTGQVEDIELALFAAIFSMELVKAVEIGGQLGDVTTNVELFEIGKAVA